MRTIYLSAHPDDAVLSCGGSVFDQNQTGANVEVWTFMCGVPKDQPEENFLKRIKEDVKAVKMVGAKPVHYGFLDALYRRDQDDGKRYNDVFSPVHPLDDKLINSIALLIGTNLDPEDVLMCPLAVGEHVDHVILRMACENLSWPITYYTDFPYIEYVPEKLASATRGLAKYPQTISPNGLTHWLDAVCEYVSQDFYPTQDITRAKITEYWAKINGIFLWRLEAL